MLFYKGNSFLSIALTSILSRRTLKYINQAEAIEINDKLIDKYKFSVDQLLEFSGHCCAKIIALSYPDKKNVVVCCGPGNNGGDGLVCARHLIHYGFQPKIFYPIKNDEQVYQNLFYQCESLDIPSVNCLHIINKECDLVVDAIFGSKFLPPVRDVFTIFIKALKNTARPICSIDVPSGWDVNKDQPVESGIQPEMLLSLNAPKVCSKSFKGKHHYLIGRNLPFKLAQEHDLQLPNFPGTENFVKLNS